MKQIKVNPNNEQFYSKEFIRGFNLGAERQYEADIADMPKWIPCSERLPETEINVLIWLPSHWNKNGGTIEIGFLDEDNEWNWLAESMSGYYEIVEGVSAWMPLPDVWEGDGNNEKVRCD